MSQQSLSITRLVVGMAWGSKESGGPLIWSLVLVALGVRLWFVGNPYINLNQ
jgi:hypothetical protein